MALLAFHRTARPRRRRRRLASWLRFRVSLFGAAIVVLGFLAAPSQSAASPGALRILIVHADVTPPSTLQSQVAARPGVSAVDLFDALAATPTVAQLSAYDEVVVFSNAVFQDAVALGDRLADYQDAGGIVVAVLFSYSDSTFELKGRWMTGGYTPFTPSTTYCSFCTADLGSFDASSPLMSGVASLHTDYRADVTLASGATLAASWDSAPTPAVASKGPGVGINAYVGDAVPGWSGDFAKVIVNAGNALGPRTLTVTKGGSGAGTVTSTPAGIDCGSTCSASFSQGSSVTLSAAASSGSAFAGWSGGCTGTGACTVTMDAAKTVTATFNAAPAGTVGGGSGANAGAGGVGGTVLGSGGNGGDAGPCGGGAGGGGALAAGGGGEGGGGCFLIPLVQKLSAGAVSATAVAATGNTTVKARLLANLGSTRTARHSRLTLIGQKTLSGLATGRHPLVVRLSKKARRAFRRRDRVKVTLRLTMSVAPTGRPLTVTRQVTLTR